MRLAYCENSNSAKYALEWWILATLIFIVVAVVVYSVPSKSINLDTSQLAYIEDSKAEGQSFSDRTRELLEIAMELEQE